MNNSVKIVITVVIISIVFLGFFVWKWMPRIEVKTFVRRNDSYFYDNRMENGERNENDSGELVAVITVESGDVLGDSEITEEDKKEIQETPIITNTPKPAVINQSNNGKKQEVTSNATFYIKINKAHNVITVYTKDEDGEYTVPYKAMTCSTGTETPATGKKHKITSYRARWNALQGNVYGQYATQIIGNILFHSVPYTSKKNSALEYWEYDKLGTKASAGCIRLTVADAKWIYDNIAAGTIVEFYEDASSPGPLGKPSTQLISDNEECRGWDPTDMAEGNPWREIEKVVEEEVIPEVEENVENLPLENENIVEEKATIENSEIEQNESGEIQTNKIPEWLDTKR